MHPRPSLFEFSAQQLSFEMFSLKLGPDECTHNSNVAQPRWWRTSNAANLSIANNCKCCKMCNKPWSSHSFEIGLKQPRFWKGWGKKLVTELNIYCFSACAHLAFLQSCNAVAFLQEDKCVFVGWIFMFTHVWRTTTNLLIYLPYPTSDFTATCCSKVPYDTILFLTYCKNVKCELIHSNTYVIIFL